MNELFEFIMGSEITRYTSSTHDIVYNGSTYKAVSISRNEISRDSFNDEASIKAFSEIYPLYLFKNFNPSYNVFLRVLNSSGIQLFVGRVKDVEFNADKGDATIRLATLGSLLKTKVPFRTYSRNCSFECFGDGCELDKEKFKITLLGSECEFSKDFMSIKSSKIDKPDNYFKDGYVEVNKRVSFVVSSKIGEIKLMFPLSDLNSSSVIHCYAGCDKLLNTCKTKFNNSLNFGGFAFVPSKNPITQGY